MLSKTRTQAIRRSLPSEATSLVSPKMFAALGDPTRWKLFSLLVSHKDLCVTDLANILGISVPAASQHLRILELCGLVHKERMGQSMCYQVQRESTAAQMVTRLVKAIND